MSYPILSQRSSDCADLKIGYTAQPVGQYGCLFVSILMMVCRDQAFDKSYYRAHMDCLKDHGNYTQAGAAYLQSFDVSQCRPPAWGPCVCQNPHATQYTGIDMPAAEIAALVAWLRAGQSAVIEVDDRGPNATSVKATHKDHQHFVLAVGVNTAGQIVIHDPWVGDETTLTPRYGNTNAWAIYRAILYKTSNDPASAPAPPPIAPPIGLGVHVLANGHSDDEANHPSALGYAQQRDCKVFTIMNDQDAAARQATGDPRAWTPDSNYPLIFYRQYHENQAWSPQQMIDQLGGLLNWHNNNVVITLCNEWDINIAGASNTADGMRKFCAWTLDCIDRLHARGFNNIAWLTSSMGTPGIDVQAIADVVKEMIAPRWNSGDIRWTDMHLYSPDRAHIDKPNEWIYFERRWEWLYQRCGFLPTAPGWIVSTEWGLDEGGIGGYNAHGMSREETLAHMSKCLQVQQRPFVVNGVTYPSRFKAGTIYTGYDGDPKWGLGFGVQRFEPLPWRSA